MTYQPGDYQPGDIVVFTEAFAEEKPVSRPEPKPGHPKIDKGDTATIISREGNTHIYTVSMKGRVFTAHDMWLKIHLTAGAASAAATPDLRDYLETIACGV